MSAKKKAARKKTRTRLVRVVPYNERLGYLSRNITWSGRKFTHQWTEVPAAIAVQLRDLDQPGRPGVRLFDVKTESQVERMEALDKDKELRSLINANKLKESELREQARRRNQARDDYDDPEETDDELDEDAAAEVAEKEAAESAQPGDEDEPDFDPDPDPDGSKADAELREEEDGTKDWSEWEADLNATADEEVDGPPTPAKRKPKAAAKKKTTKTAKKKTTKAKGGRGRSKS